jgi:hypothetical protein
VRPTTGLLHGGGEDGYTSWLAQFQLGHVGYHAVCFVKQFHERGTRRRYRVHRQNAAQ